MICVEIDELTPCLISCLTGEIIDTEVIRITRKSFLEKFNEKNGWYINWTTLLNGNEIYALVVKGTVSIQGLIALHRDDDMKATFIDWAVANPSSNTRLVDHKEYTGIGGHLFAIAVDKSIQQGFGGAITGFAANKDLLNYYMEAFNAEYIGILHPYQMFIDEENGAKIRGAYTYEWTNDEL